jgi:hypothetical protein
MSPTKGCLYGVRTAALILVFILAVVAFRASTEFDGDCISFEPPIQSCTLGRFLVQAVVLTVIAAPFTHPFVFFPILFLIISFPIIGLGTGVIRSRASTRS